MPFRTDDHNNPTAFTTDIAKEGGLILGTDYEQGKIFTVGLNTYYTAKLLGDPITLTITVLNKIGFYTHAGNIRWIYIGIPQFIWDALDKPTRVKVIGFMYGHEGGVVMKGLFV
jgi:hypothetical protein